MTRQKLKNLLSGSSSYDDWFGSNLNERLDDIRHIAVPTLQALDDRLRAVVRQFAERYGIRAGRIDALVRCATQEYAVAAHECTDGTTEMTTDDRFVSSRFPRSSAYHPEWILASVSGGANSLQLTEWLTEALDLRPGMRVLDLGCGRAASSVFLRREFGVQVWATDLWFSASERLQRIQDAGRRRRRLPDRRRCPIPAVCCRILRRHRLYRLVPVTTERIPCSSTTSFDS